MATKIRLYYWLIPVFIFILLSLATASWFLIPPGALPAFISKPISQTKNAQYLKTHHFNITSNVPGRGLAINYYEPFVELSKLTDGVKTLNLNLVDSPNGLKSNVSDIEGKSLFNYNFTNDQATQTLTIDIFIDNNAPADELTEKLISYAVLRTTLVISASNQQQTHDPSSRDQLVEQTLAPARISSFQNYPISFTK